MQGVNEKLSSRPHKLASNRVWRTYHGGKMLEAWQGGEQPTDNSMPEEWIASVVRARNVGREHIVEGLSRVLTEGAEEVTLQDLIAADPVGFLGRRHHEKYGSETGVLVKALDAAERLTIQVHPDRVMAQEIFQSQFGKTEAWYILGGREIEGQPPYILYGFKPGMTRDTWEKLFWDQDIEGMIQALHKIEVQPGQVILVEGGMPHAIGSGCFLIEIQEPTDYTIRIERTTPTGRVIPDAMCHQGAGFDRMFDCFHYETYSLDEIKSRYRLQPKLIQKTESFEKYALLSYENTPYFGLESIEIKKQYALHQHGEFSVLVVAEGAGTLSWENGRVRVTRGDQIFLPAGVDALICESEHGDEPLHLLRCLPPRT
ncbi:type I phosphomannose isomerase catalytic subunit [Paenibacillus qinlingensis]|nr:type I phosphomannose isomerase catalytic subunit [Paenibacillus qinlingensis]